MLVDNGRMLVGHKMEINVKKSTKRKECKLNFQTCVVFNVQYSELLNIQHEYIHSLYTKHLNKKKKRRIE